MTREHRRRVAFAEQTVRRAFGSAPSWYIALSGGKDSTVVLDLVRRVAPETRANFSQREWDLPETIEYLSTIPNLSRVSYEAHAGQEWLPNWSSRAKVAEAGVRWLSGDEIARRGSAEDGAFLGLRADENDYRRKHLSRFGPLYQCERTGVWHCNPIAWWSVMDVWAYIVSRGVRYNVAYDVLDRIGVPLEQQRVGPFAFALHGGALALIKRGWPQFFNELAARHPEARQYA